MTLRATLPTLHLPIAARAPALRRAWRAPLAAKLAAALIGLVILVLVVNGAINTWLTYEKARHAALEVQEEKARSAAVRVGEFLAEIETQLGWTTGAEWRFAKPDQQRYDFVRLLRQAAAITELAYLDGMGKEQLKVSRLEPDSVGSGRDFSNDPRFVRAVADKVWFGPVEFRRGSEPYMTIALAHVGRTPGVTVADVNLKLIWDVISAIRVGDKGYAFVVDGQGRLIAHPDLSLVLRNTDFSKLPQVRMALADMAPMEPGASSMAGPHVGMAEFATGLDGGSVLTAYAVAPKTHWIVFVQLPLAEALASVYKSLLQTVALLGLGLALALIVGGLLARRMVAPIRLLQQGAERLGAGDLSQRLDIRTGDEIETLAGGFNRMAGRLQESYENLGGKVEARTRDLENTLERQTATAEILKVIASSPSDARPVFDAIALAGNRLLRCNSGVFACEETTYWPIVAGIDGRLAALYGPEKAPIDVERNFPSRAIVSGQTYHLPDWSLIDLPEVERQVAEESGFRSTLYLPLMKNDKCLGLLTFGSRQARHFGDAEIALAESFRDQALIAIENTRLFNDTKEALERQTATAEILKVIASSPAYVQPVFEAIVASAKRLLGGMDAALTRIVGNQVHLGAFTPLNPEADAARVAYFPRGFEDPIFVELLAGRSVLIADSETITLDLLREGARQVGWRSLVVVPLMSQGTALGGLSVARESPGAFAEEDLELLRTFADQAVIAVENARLLNDTKEALKQQTATADVLKVISRSAFDLDAIFQTLVTTAVDLCKASSGTLCVRDGDAFRYRGMAGPEATSALQRYLEAHPLDAPTRQTAAGRAILSRQTEQIEDVTLEVDYAVPMAAQGSPARSLLAVPLMGKSEVLGAIVVARVEPGAFPPRHVEILRTFADQAVIAIENSSLFEEVQAKTRDLEQLLERQIATSEILKAIAASPSNLQPVFDAIVENSKRLLKGVYVVSFRYVEGFAHVAAATPIDPEFDELVRTFPPQPLATSPVFAAIRHGQAAQAADVELDDPFNQRDLARRIGLRSAMFVPLISAGEAIGSILVSRKAPGRFAPQDIELLKSFADQAVIAIENAGLFEQVQARTRELSQSLDDLRKAQDRLVQSEKLASLGQLTAGIAHEIKNPLNFVNNFSALSRELLDELSELLAKAKLAQGEREEADELIGMVAANLDKVVSHGKRADSIVKNMLLHSREGSGERAPVDLNALVEEAVNLAYHGARAEKPGFTVTIDKSLDPHAGEVDLYAQEMTRVLLNIVGNGFYATAKRKQSQTNAAFEPRISVRTRDLGERVEIAVRDNGTGMPDDVKAKIFNPFFTTKPAGEGTGLGLSLSHDIVVKQHGGTLDVESAPGEFTEFRIGLPRGGGQETKRRPS